MLKYRVSVFNFVLNINLQAFFVPQAVQLFLTFSVLKMLIEKLTHVKDTHREKATSNKTPALTKSRNMSFWVVNTSSQLLIRGY